MAASASLSTDIRLDLFPFKSVSEVPDILSRLAKMLRLQPLFVGKGSIVNPSKVITVASCFDARICDIFSKNVQKTLGKERTWDIHDFGSGNIQLYEMDGNPLGDGVQLWLFEGQFPCPIPELKEAYAEVVRKLQAGWESAKVEDYPNILHTKDPTEFDLFIKCGKLVEEEILVSSLVAKFSMKSDVSCHDQWINAEQQCERGNLYLWARKSKLPVVLGRLGFPSQHKKT